MVFIVQERIIAGMAGWIATLLIGWLSAAGVQVGVHVPLSGYDVLSGSGVQAALEMTRPLPELGLGLAFSLDGFKGEEQYRLHLWSVGPRVAFHVRQVTLGVGAGLGQITRRRGTGQERGTFRYLALDGRYVVLHWPSVNLELVTTYTLIPGADNLFHYASVGLGVSWEP